MVDDDQTMALNQDGGEVTTPDTTPVSETETTEVSQETQDTQLQDTETAESGKKGYSQRVQELANSARAEKARADSLEEKLAKLTGNSEPQPFIPQQAQPLPDLVQPGEELTAEELNRRIGERDRQILQQSQSYTNLMMQQNKVLDQINKDARSVVKKYQQLNPESETYNPKLSEAITEATEAYVRANPTASVKKFVDKLMEPYQQSVQKEVGEMTETVAKQVSQSALRPTTIKQQEKSVADMTIAEMEAKYGIVQS